MSFLNRFLEDPPHDDALASVIRNLEHLLSSRPGYGSPLRGFGVGDYLGQQGHKAAQLAILREIRSVIDTYEPRLRVRGIVASGRDAELRMNIEVSALLLTRTSSQPCRLRILFHLPSGAIEIAPLPTSAPVRHAP